jgi:hypothetical protein
MSDELRQVANGFEPRVKSYTGYDVNGYRFHTSRHEQTRPNRKTTNSQVFTLGTDGIEYYGVIEEIYELLYDGRVPLTPVIFKCHWFDPRQTRRTPHLGLVEIRHDFVYIGKDVYIVAQQAVQVYHTPYACTDKDHLKGWSIVHQVSSHGKLPLPNDEDYTFDTNTYDGEFYQADGLEGRFEIVLPEITEMEVDNEMVDDDDPGDVVVDLKDIEMLERFHLGRDNEENTEPSDSVAHLDNFDSDDETYDPGEDYS